MATSSLTSSSPEIKHQQCNKLFYDQWHYCLRFHLNGLTCLRNARRSSLPEYLDSIQEHWQFRRNFYKYTGGKNLRVTSGSWAATDGDLLPIANFARCLYAHLATTRLVMTGDVGHLYANDITVLEQIAQALDPRGIEFKQAVVTRSRDRLTLRRSQHQYRSYLRDSSISQRDRASVWQYISQQPNIRISRSATKWFEQNLSNSNSCYSRSYFFIDHDDPGIVLMLEMIKHRLIRCTLPIDSINN